MFDQAKDVVMFGGKPLVVPNEHIKKRSFGTGSQSLIFEEA